MSGQPVLDLVRYLLVAATATVWVRGVIAIWKFGRVLKTVRPDLFRPDEFSISGDFSEYWALYTTPHPNPALERPRRLIVQTFKWWWILMGMWLL